MSTSDEADLEQRALAAMRDAARRKAEQDEQARQARLEAAWLQAKQTHPLITSAISKLEEILDHRTRPADWKTVRWNVGTDEDRYVDVAYTSLLGLTIRTADWQSPDLLVQIPYHRWAILTLEKLGEALEAWKVALWPPEPWPPKQYRA
jgi:hypothetical protein